MASDAVAVALAWRREWRRDMAVDRRGRLRVALAQAWHEDGWSRELRTHVARHRRVLRAHDVAPASSARPMHRAEGRCDARALGQRCALSAGHGGRHEAHADVGRRVVSRWDDRTFTSAEARS